MTEVSCFGCGVVWCWLCPVQERRIAEKQIEMAKQVSRELYRLLEGQKSIVLYKSAKRLQRVKRTHAYIYK